jgi:hypothetical protein
MLQAAPPDEAGPKVTFHRKQILAHKRRPIWLSSSLSSAPRSNE